MKHILLDLLLVISFSITAPVLTSCQTNAGSTSKAVDKQKPRLQSRIEGLATTVGGRVGVAAVLLETGESVFVNGTDHFPMQSVYKLPIGMTVLQQVDAGKLKLEQRVRVEKSDFISRAQHSPIRDKNPGGVELTVSDLLRFAVSESDGTASDVLLRLCGGPTAVRTYLDEIKVKDLIVLNTEKEIGQDNSTQYRNWASPDAALALLSALHKSQGLSESSRAFLLNLMTDTPTGLKRLKGLLPSGTIVAHKTGTSGTTRGVTAATNDIGIITLPDGRHVAMAVFVTDSPSDEVAREAVIAKIAKEVWDEWAPSRN